MKGTTKPTAVGSNKKQESQATLLDKTECQSFEQEVLSMPKYEVLIVHDKNANLEFYKQSLQSTFTIFFADNTEKLQEILDTENHINLVFLDIKEFSKPLEIIKQHSVYYSIPTVLCTDRDFHDDISLAMNSDILDVWVKPYNEELFLFRTQKIISMNSVIDEKTGLLCQEAFISRAEKILKQSPQKTFYLIRYDIDNFKIYNHTYGIADGDRLLKYIGQKSNALANSESLFCRWETDHFVALIEEHYLSSKNLIRYFTKLKQPFHPEYKLSIRMGLYKITNHSIPIVQMCDKALIAHKSSKTEMSSLYAFYDDRVLEEQIEEQKITDEMEKALLEEQFVVYLQPQYNQATMQLYGAEALVRWIHPEKGIISPVSFIPLFEKNGFILKLDCYIFRKVCEIQRKWLDEGLNVVPISVNLSRAEALNENLCDELLAVLGEYHLTTKYINLEITESAYMDNPYQVVSLTKRLQEAGFEIEMDDFGSGYSSLNTLKEIPVNVLKLDLKFLSGNDESNRTTKILSSVIRMAHGMSMPIIAEGVETLEQANFLKSLGCFYIQGFYFDKPMPAKEFETRLKSYLPDTVKKNRFSTELVEPQKIDIPSLLNEFVGPAGIVEYDEFRIEGTRCNNLFYDFFDFSPEDYPNYQLDLKDNFADEDYQIFENTLKRAMVTKEICECDIQLLPKLNRVRPTWIRLRISFLYSSSRIHTFYVRVEDIDVEKRKDIRLRDINADIYALADCLPGGALSFEYKEGKLSGKYANDTIGTMLGIPISEYFDNTKEDFFYYVFEDDKQALTQKVLEAFDNFETFIEHSYRLKHKSGNLINIHTYCKITHNPDGTKYAVAAILVEDEKIQHNEYILHLEKENQKLKKKIFALQDNLDVSTDIEETTNNKAKKISTIREPEYDCKIVAVPEYKLAEEYGNFAVFKYSMLKNKFIEFSDSLPKLFGYTREEFFSKFDDSLEKLVWKEDSKDVVEKIQRQQRMNRGDICAEHRVQTKSGELKWVRGRARKVVEEFGNEYYIGTIVDIDIERGLYRTIDSQRFTINSFENNIEGATIRWKISGSKWILDFVSKKNESLFGYPMTKLLSTWEDNPYQFVHPNDVESIKKETINTLKKNSRHVIQFRIITKDGDIRWVKSYGQYYPLVKNEGFFVATCYDITERLDAENQLYEEKQKSQSLIDALPGGIVLYEIRPDKLKVQYVSSKVAHMFGKTKEEFVDTVENNKDLGIFDKDMRTVVRSIKRLERTGEPFEVDFRVKHKDGYLVWATVNAVKTGTNKGNPTFLAVYQNKTEHTDTLDQILSKSTFFVVVFDANTKEMLYANPQAEILANKKFDPFNPNHVSEFLYGSRIPEFEAPIPKAFDKDEYKTVRDNKNLLVKRFRVDWNGHDAIIVMAEEFFEK